MSDYDLVIRHGSVVDGSGGPAFRADVAVKDGVIVKVGEVVGHGAEEIDASGKIVTPGFVDVHTHYDGQVTWEHHLAPSSDHGVTTVVTGNCGVGFAPCRKADRDKLVTVMEGVEDIPEIVMVEGIPWNWETFPEYMESIADRGFDIDVGVQIPHSPIRIYVMGDRGVNHEASTDADRAAMTRLVTEAIEAGAVGVSTSRSLNHRAKDGTLAPSVHTVDDEVLALAAGLDRAQAGVFQLITDTSQPAASEMAMVRKIAEVSGRPVSFTLAQTLEHPEGWRGLVKGIEEANAAGHQVRGQVIGRPVGILLGLDLSFNPLSGFPSYAAIADLPLAQRVETLRDPAFKAQVLAEEPVEDKVSLNKRSVELAASLFVMGPDVDYAPGPDKRVGALAAAAGVDVMSKVYDLLLEDDGHAVLTMPIANFAYGNLDAAREMIAREDTVLGLGDGGAHYGVICDAGFSTHLLTYWVKDAPQDQRFSLEWAIHSLSRKPAETVCLFDRGLVAEGMKADLNVIDFDRLKLHAPRPIYNLPTGARRIQQKADGYEATIVSGAVTYRNGVPTGSLPGRLIRGAGYKPQPEAVAA